MRNEVVLKRFGMGFVKMHSFHGNPLYDSWEWGSAYISRVLLIKYHYRCQIKALTDAFFHVVRYVNHLICIFMNITENLKTMR